VSRNGVIVNQALPHAIAAAAAILGRNETLRKLMGEEGRKTVISYFNTERQMSQYAKLYRTLYNDRMRHFPT